MGGERGKSRRRRRREDEKAKHLGGLGRGLIVQGWSRELLACKVIVFDAVILQCRACTHASQPRAADTSRRSVVITAPVLFLLPSPSSLLSLFRRRLANRDSYPPDPRHPSAKSTRAKNTPLSRVFETRRRFLERTRHPSSSRARLEKYPPLSLEEKEEEERERERSAAIAGEAAPPEGRKAVRVGSLDPFAIVRMKSRRKSSSEIESMSQRTIIAIEFLRIPLSPPPPV